MNRWIVTLVVVAVVGGSLAVFLRLRGRERQLGPRIEERDVLDNVVVWFGQVGEMEFLLRPFYADPVRDDFNSDRFDRLTRSPVGRHRWALVWVVNHSPAEPRQLPRDLLRVGAETDAVSYLDDLAGAPGVPDYFRLLAAAYARSETVAPGEVRRIAVGLPGGIRVESLSEAECAGVTLRRARIALADLLLWEQRPRGRIAGLVEPSAQDSEPPLEAASRTR